MGNLLKVLTCTDLEQEPNFFLDFESEIFLPSLSTLSFFVNNPPFSKLPSKYALL